MKRIILLIPFLAVASTAIAQDQVTIGDVLDLEERIMVKHMTDELAKPNPNAPPAPVIVPVAQKVVYPTEMLASYGTSATFYEAQLSYGGHVYPVRVGTNVQGYTVTNITPTGLEMIRTVPMKVHGKHRRTAQVTQTLFAPLAAH
jgi:hypothetical protein